MAKNKAENHNIITENGNTYTLLKLSDGKELKIRHPKGRDLRFAMSGTKGDEAALTFKLASNLTCLSEAELDELEAKDCALILGVAAGFLS
ncbi:phage tail assembly protein [Campylobacter sp. RM9344]|uniref:Phage tail assembly protein n=1 Tax=Campylobacter californiensis TaxID=1032243 RepID=A0AAW3ZY55_9BACT|nr:MULTISPECIES: phage tail assembly protein [unclassified Campylobacter]MBE2985463.1 phage tail assembly protein [Campylobacter sp. RM6883]MBE2986561.1 phage tail assembly protein [Campylobacter sp. RM12919]MBE2987644.1 phage tail assembly protein [Campylobacter sp. RM12920]MBE2995982.1 phage tail assembly protein [Campylobacter sp. RM6913]MBE3029269.1 phage tail assembly protein [Campylobacter sp. RM9344]